MSKIVVIVALLYVFAPFKARATTTPPAKTLSERVALATHVIVGTAKKLRVLKRIGDEWKEVTPEPASIEPRDQMYAEIEIEVSEVVYPFGWKPPKSVKYWFGGGIFSVDRIRGEVLGEERIYLMKGPTKAPDNTYFPSYVWHLSESLEHKAEIQVLLKANDMEGDGVKTPAIHLTVATVLSSPNVFALSLTNLGKEPITIGGLSEYPLKCVFIKPNGGRVEFWSIVGPPGIGTLPKLSPGATKRWDVPISDFFGRKMWEKGMYRFTWVWTISDDPLVELKSNEVLIMKDESSPKLSLSTAQPE